MFSSMQQLSVQVEKTSNIVRKLTIKVPQERVAESFERGLIEVQRTAKIKGFRPGNVPIPVIKQYYGEDLRHRLFHSLVDETFEEAVRENKLRTVGAPEIEAADHKTGEGSHDHAISEEKDFTYVATVEVMPEIEVKGYTGLSLTRESAEVKDADVEKILSGLRDAHAELIPIGGGLTLPDGTQSSRPVQKGDHVDTTFSGGVVTEKGIEERPGMKGNRLIEIGSEALIPGFEEQMIGMRRGETKTFRISFPKDYSEAELSGKEAEFTVTANELKEKKVPALDEEFAKQTGHESLAELRKKIHDRLLLDRTRDADRKLQSELLAQVIEKNPFDVPKALIEAQARALAQDWANELKQQGFKEPMIQDALKQELENLHKRAENQVRASLVLEAIAAKEKVAVTPEELRDEVAASARAMKVEEGKLAEYYERNPGRREDFEFRLRQDKTVKFLLDKAKIKSGS
jgi:trigger factor